METGAATTTTTTTLTTTANTRNTNSSNSSNSNHHSNIRALRDRIEKWRQAGDRAAAVTETVHHAVALYTLALRQLEEQNTYDNDDDSDDTWIHLERIDLLDRRAHVQEDPLAAVADWQTAYDLCLQQQSSSVAATAATVVDPATMASLMMNLGQAMEGLDALERYQSGLKWLERGVLQQQEAATTALAATAKATATVSADPASVNTATTTTTSLYDLHRDMALACAAVADLYLTDLCYEETAEFECNRHCERALAALTQSDAAAAVVKTAVGVATATAANHTNDTNTPMDEDNAMDATITTTNVPPQLLKQQQQQQQPMYAWKVQIWQTCASLRLSQRRPRDAVRFLELSYGSMETACCAVGAYMGWNNDINDTEDSTGTAAATDNKKIHNTNELQAVEEVQALPPFEVRCQTAKLLLECSFELAAATAAQRGDDAENNDGNHTTAIATTTAYTDDSDGTKISSMCASHARNVLASLVAERDEVPDIWALCGDVAHQLGEEETAVAHWTHAVEQLTAVQASLLQTQQASSLSSSLLVEDNYDEDDLIQQQLDDVVCQIQDLHDKCEEVQATMTMAMTDERDIDGKKDDTMEE